MSKGFAIHCNYGYIIKTACLLFAFFLAGNCFAQYRPWDTVAYYVKNNKPVYLIELDGRNSFIREAPVKIDGLRVGVDYGNKIRFFLGAYLSRGAVERTFITNRYTVNERHVRQRLSMFYMAATAEYVVYNSPHWELAVPVQIGFGKGNRWRYDGITGVMFEHKQPAFVPFEVSFRAMYRILPWLNVSAGLGYRYALFSNSVSDDFSAPVYTYGIGISPVKLLKKLNILEEKNGKLRFVK